MAATPKVRSLVTGNPGMDTFIREVRAALGGNSISEPGASSRVVPWDENHALAFSFSNQVGANLVRNEGAAGPSHVLTLGGSVLPRFGFPSPVGDAIEFASETSGATSYLTGLGSYTTKPNDYSVECLVFTHHSDRYGSADSAVLCQKTGVLAMSWPDGGQTYATPAGYWWQSGVQTSLTAPYQVAVPPGQWSHIMFTASSTAGKRLYVDGRLVSSSTNTNATGTNTNSWFIGAPNAGTVTSPFNQYRYFGAMARWSYSTVVRPQSYAKLVSAKLRGW